MHSINHVIYSRQLPWEYYIFEVMADNAFRKIDIDAFDEDVLQEGELYEADPRNPNQILGDAKQKAVAVRSLLAK
jgi:hypothetical protein